MRTLAGGIRRRGCLRRRRPAARAADDPLKVCLDENLPPLSAHHRGKPDSGFDVALAQAIADRLGRPLKIQWFESKLDEDSSPALEANALLSDGRCSLVGSYALTKDSLVVPGVKTAKLPDFEGATRADRRRRVPLGVLAPSQPYVYSPLTVVLGARRRATARSPASATSPGLRIAIESGTLGDAILMTFENGRLIDNITHLVPGRRRSARRARSRRLRCDVARPAPVRRLPRRPSRHQACRVRLLLSDRRQSRLCRPRQRSGPARRRQQGALRFAGRGNHRRARPGRRPHLSAAARARDPRRRVAEECFSNRRATGSSSVIASGAKQSMAGHKRRDGLLRRFAPRNDGVCCSI